MNRLLKVFFIAVIVISCSSKTDFLTGSDQELYNLIVKEINKEKKYVVLNHTDFDLLEDMITTLQIRFPYSSYTREAYLLRHKINFSIYFLGVYLIYLFSKELFKNRYIGFLTSMFYFLHPRLFAHGFYNGKDSIAQALVKNKTYLLKIQYSGF